MRLKFLASPDVSHLDAEVLAVLPIGSIEQHARHLPLGTDALAAEAVAEHLEALAPDRVLLLPPVPYGASDHHRAFPGTVSIGTETLGLLVHRVVLSLVETTGLSRVLILNGHGGNVPAMRWALERLASDAPNLSVWGISYWDALFAALRVQNDGPAGSMGHADRHETSIILAVNSELVAPNPVADRLLDGLPDWVFSSRGFDERTENGGVGDPFGASVEEGRRFLRLAAASIATVLLDEPPSQAGGARAEFGA